MRLPKLNNFLWIKSYSLNKYFFMYDHIHKYTTRTVFNTPRLIKISITYQEEVVGSLSNFKKKSEFLAFFFNIFFKGDPFLKIRHSGQKKFLNYCLETSDRATMESLIYIIFVNNSFSCRVSDIEFSKQKYSNIHVCFNAEFYVSSVTEFKDFFEANGYGNLFQGKFKFLFIYST
jgi:hypothetical protein